MLKLESVASFVSVVETGSIAGAARRLGMKVRCERAPLGSRESPGTQLIRRTTRKLSPTQDGYHFYGRAKQILRDVDNATAEVAS
jgi:DNA-binding transcriptional LysR family regulator